MWTPTELRALDLIQQHGASSTQAQWLLQNLRDAGIRLADLAQDELVCRWVPVSERAVPAEADTIIRTITTTRGNAVDQQSFWLDGLHPPRLAARSL